MSEHIVCFVAGVVAGGVGMLVALALVAWEDRK